MSLTLETKSDPGGGKSPKYVHVAEQLRRKIRDGVLKPDDKLPTFQQMRDEYGLTNITVERIYSTLESEGLIVRQRSRGTFVAHPESALKANPGVLAEISKGTIGVSGLGFTFTSYSGYWLRLMQGMRETAGREKAQIMLLDHNSMDGWEKANGVLLCDYVAEEVLQAIPEHLPCVAMVTPYNGMAGVVADDYSGGRIATEYLLQLGHRRICYLQGIEQVLVSRRLAGYLDALRAANIQPQQQYMRVLDRKLRYDYGDDFVFVGRESMRSWLREGWAETGCTAILTHNDDVAFGVIEALSEAGYNVPGDISVIGYDGTETGAYVPAQLTTIEVPLRQIGNAAAQLLLRQIGEDRKSYEQQILPVQLQVRETTGPARLRV